MNKHLAFVLLLALTCLAASGADAPPIVASGFDAYKATGSRDALATWLRGGAPSAGISVEGLPPDIGPGIEKPGAFGPMETYEIIAVYSPTARLRRVYAVAYFPQGPLFCCFDLYRNAGAWVTYGLKISLVPDQVLPVELVERQG